MVFRHYGQLLGKARSKHLRNRGRTYQAGNSCSLGAQHPSEDAVETAPHPPTTTRPAALAGR